jgi:hypothetical protein
MSESNASLGVWYAWWSDKANEAGNDVYVYMVEGRQLRAHGISESPEFPTIGWEDKKLVGTVPNGFVDPQVIQGFHKRRMMKANPTLNAH